MNPDLEDYDFDGEWQIFKKKVGDKHFWINPPFGLEDGNDYSCYWNNNGKTPIMLAKMNIDVFHIWVKMDLVIMSKNPSNHTTKFKINPKNSELRPMNLDDFPFDEFIGEVKTMKDLIKKVVWHVVKGNKTDTLSREKQATIERILNTYASLEVLKEDQKITNIEVGLIDAEPYFFSVHWHTERAMKKNRLFGIDALYFNYDGRLADEP